MKTLAAGPQKYLLIDAERVTRNAERARAGSPVGLVVEIVDGKPVQHRCSTFEIRGTTQLFYGQQRPVRLAHGLEVHAALVTPDEVVLDAAAEPSDDAAPAATPAATQTARPARKSQNQKTPE